MLPIKLSLPKHFLDEEVRAGYTISSDMKKIWAVELDLLDNLLRVCEKHQLPVFASDGTLLGAIRHQGMIPWDNDIDVTMKRKDFDRLCEIAPYEFQSPYFFQTNETDPGSCRGHGQLRNSNTTAILKRDWKRGVRFNQGIFIDVFPLDNVPDDPKERKKFIEKVRKTRVSMIKWESLTTRYNPKADKSKLKFIKTSIHCIAKCLYIKNPYYKKYEQMRRKYNSIETEFCGDLAIVGLQKGFFQRNKDMLELPETVPFEILHIPVPKNYLEILDRRYGQWQEYVIDQSFHGDTFFDVDSSFENYISGQAKGVSFEK